MNDVNVFGFTLADAIIGLWMTFFVSIAIGAIAGWVIRLYFDNVTRRNLGRQS